MKETITNIIVYTLITFIGSLPFIYIGMYFGNHLSGLGLFSMFIGGCVGYLYGVIYAVGRMREQFKEYERQIAQWKEINQKNIHNFAINPILTFIESYFKGTEVTTHFYKEDPQGLPHFYVGTDEQFVEVKMTQDENGKYHYQFPEALEQARIELGAFGETDWQEDEEEEDDE